VTAEDAAVRGCASEQVSNRLVRGWRGGGLQESSLGEGEGEEDEDDIRCAPLPHSWTTHSIDGVGFGVGGSLASTRHKVITERRTATSPSRWINIEARGS
jgi:hypothetical protein